MNVKLQKQTRAQVKALTPSTSFLFGGGVKDISQNVKASEELNPLAVESSSKFDKKRKAKFQSFGHAKKFGGAGGFGHVGFKGRGGGQQASGSGRGKGGPGKSRLNQFKD